MRKTIFISSTFDDLKTHRRKVWDLLESYDVDVRGMEKFGARKEAPLVTCLSEVEQSDIFVCIIAYRLGSLDPSSGKSFTQLEYERARELNRELLIYLIDDNEAKVQQSNIDFDEKREKLLAFKATLKDRHTIDTFVTEEDLSQKLKIRLDALLMPAPTAPMVVVDEFASAKDLINKFLLLPALHSGREVKLLVEFTAEAFPASKSICSHFNLDFGKTIGVPIKVNKPKLSSNPIEYVFIDDSLADQFFSLSTKADVPIYAKLQFSDSEIVDIEANFVRRNVRKFSISRRYLR